MLHRTDAYCYCVISWWVAICGGMEGHTLVVCICTFLERCTPVFCLEGEGCAPEHVVCCSMGMGAWVSIVWGYMLMLMDVSMSGYEVCINMCQ